MSKTCFKCGKDVQLDYQIVPLEVPYINIYFCRDCFGVPADDNPPAPLLDGAYATILDNMDKLNALVADNHKKSGKDKK
jgi:hypothetical protein